MPTINKYVTIKYSKGGIAQYAEVCFYNDEYILTRFNPSWCKSDEIPSLEGLKTVDEILAVIKNFAYCNQAKIHLINGHIPSYYHNNEIRSDVNDAAVEMEKVLERLCTDFFKKHLLPIIKKNKWKVSNSWIGRPVLIYKDKKTKEWYNIKENDDSLFIEYSCYQFLYGLNLADKISLENEQGYISINEFCTLASQIPQEVFEKLKIYVEVE